MMNRKGFERKRLWSNLIYCTGIFREELLEQHETLFIIVGVSAEIRTGYHRMKLQGVTPTTDCFVVLNIKMAVTGRLCVLI